MLYLTNFHQQPLSFLIFLHAVLSILWIALQVYWDYQSFEERAMFRRLHFQNNQYYHVFNKSIAKYKIFCQKRDFQRMLATMHYYQYEDMPFKYSLFLKNYGRTQETLADEFQRLTRTRKKRVEIVAYCIMPTHFHLLVQQKAAGGVSSFMHRVLDSYTRYFNIKYDRKGPLWVGNFKDVVIESSWQLLYTTRYIHFNPCEAGMSKNPKDWEYSSYQEFVSENPVKGSMVKSEDVLEHLHPIPYTDFVKNPDIYLNDLET
jgi:putative transposase